MLVIKLLSEESSSKEEASSCIPLIHIQCFSSSIVVLLVVVVVTVVALMSHDSLFLREFQNDFLQLLISVKTMQ